MDSKEQIVAARDVARWVTESKAHGICNKGSLECIYHCHVISCVLWLLLLSSSPLLLILRENSLYLVLLHRTELNHRLILGMQDEDTCKKQ